MRDFPRWVMQHTKYFYMAVACRILVKRLSSQMCLSVCVCVCPCSGRPKSIAIGCNAVRCDSKLACNAIWLQVHDLDCKHTLHASCRHRRRRRMQDLLWRDKKRYFLHAISMNRAIAIIFWPTTFNFPSSSYFFPSSNWMPNSIELAS